MRVEQEYQKGRQEVPVPVQPDTVILANRLERIVDALWDVQLIADPAAFFLFAPVKQVAVTGAAAGNDPAASNSKLLFKNELEYPVMLEAWLNGDNAGHTAWLLLGSSGDEAVLSKSRNKAFGEAPRVKCIVPVGAEVYVNATDPSGAGSEVQVNFSVVSFRSRGSVFSGAEE